jgi:hypothetical protein
VSARHGFKWYEIDMNWYGIWTLKKLGLARNILLTEAESMRLRRIEPAQAGAAPAPQTNLVSAQS